jgi:hypothetical protein
MEIQVTISNVAITVAIGNETKWNGGAANRAAHRGSLDIRFNAMIANDDTKNTKNGMQSSSVFPSMDAKSLSTLFIGRFVALR